MKNYFDILYVEDSRADAAILTQLFAESDALARVHTVTDGPDALAFLRRQDTFTNAVRPHLILLDLNLPKTYGTEVLAAIKSDDNFMEIPVLIFSSSRRPEEIKLCYRLHANGFIVKPSGLDGMVSLVKSILDFWHRTVELSPST